MKRSEMIKKVAEMFEEHSNNQQYKGYSHKGLAETFLDIVEDLGMLPPTTNYYNTVLTPPTVTPTGELDYSFHRGWEKE